MALLDYQSFEQIAQAFGESVGKVEATDGLVEVVRTDGTKTSLSKGDPIYQGDKLITGDGAAVGITFIDDTTFSLGEKGEMVLDEMVYDPGSQEGVFSANLVQGVFSFVSGQIAKTQPDGMTVQTPVATIGIRGTKGAGRAAQEGSENTISLLPEVDSQGNQIVGEMSISNQSGTVTLNSVGATVQMTSSVQPPPPPVVFTQQQIQQNFGSTLTTLSTTTAIKAENDAQENAEEAEQKKEEAAQAEEEAAQAEADAAAAEAEAAEAAAEAEAAAAEAEAARIAAEAAGDEEALAAAAAAEAEAEAAAAEAEAAAEAAEAEAQAAEAAAAEAEAAAAEAAAAEAEAVEAQAMAEVAAAEAEAQAQAFATFGQPPAGEPGEEPVEGEGPPDGAEAPPDGGPGGEGDNQQADGGEPGEGEIEAAAEEAVQEALAEGATEEEAAKAGFDAAKEKALADGASPEEIAAAEAAFEEALANGATPEEAMRAAGEAAGEVAGLEGEDGFQEDGPVGPEGPDGPAGPDGPIAEGPGGPGPEGSGGPGPEGSGPEDDAVNDAAELAAREAIASGATGDEVFSAAVEAARAQAIADGTSEEDFQQGADAAEAAFQEAMASGASPEEAMAAALTAAQDQGGAEDNFNTFDNATNEGPAGTTSPLDSGPLDQGPVISDNNFNDNGNTDSGSDGSTFFNSGGDPFYAGGNTFGTNSFYGDGGGLFNDGGGFFGDDGGLYGGSGYDTFGNDSYFGNDDFYGNDGFYGNDDFFGDFYNPYDHYNPFDDIVTTDDTYYVNSANSDGEDTVATFDEVQNGTTGNDTLTGAADDNTQFLMVQGSTMGGTDNIDGGSGSGTDEIALKDLTDSIGIYDGFQTPPQIVYSNKSGTVSGTINLTSIEQIYADDGNSGSVDTTGTDVNVGSNGIRLGFGPDTTNKYGYIMAGSDSGDTLTLANTTDLSSYGSLSHTVGTTNVVGSVIFGKGGDDNITGSAGGDFLFGGDGNDTLNGGGGDGETVFGGTGNDTINVTTATGGASFIGGSGTDTLSFSSYSTSDITFTIGTSTSSSQRSSDTAYSNGGATDYIRGIEVLTGSSTKVNTFNFSGDTTGAGLTTITGGNVADTFTLASGATVSANLNGGSGNDTFTFGSGTTFSGTLDGGAGTDTLKTFHSGVSMTGSISNVSQATLLGSSSNDTISMSSTTAFGVSINAIDAGNGTDQVSLSSGSNVTLTISNAETITGAATQETLTLATTTSGGSINLAGGTDSLTLADGGNSLTASNIETITGGSGTDAVTLGAAQGSGTIDLAGGTDSLVLADGGNTLSFSNTESVTGGSGSDVLTNSSATDVTITGNSGNDTFTGNAGGVETYAFSGVNTNGFDTINTFTVGSGGDKLSLSGLGLDGINGSATSTSVQIMSADGTISNDVTAVVFDDAWTSFAGVDATASEATQLTAFLTFIGGQSNFNASLSANDKLTFIIDDTSGNNDVSVWHWADTGNGSIDSGEISAVASIDNIDISNLVTGNFS